METQGLVYQISELIDYAGVAIIAAGAALSLMLLARDLLDGQTQNDVAFENVRTRLGRSLLLGLEFLVAGDVIKTVAVAPTMDSVLVLAIIVLVRTVLSLSIGVEIDGQWPWQRAGRTPQVVTATESTPLPRVERPRDHAG